MLKNKTEHGKSLASIIKEGTTKPDNKKFPLIPIVAGAFVVVLIAAGFSGYYYMKYQKAI